MYCGQMQMRVCVQSIRSWCLKDVTFYMMTFRVINHTHSGAPWKTRHLLTTRHFALCSSLFCLLCLGPIDISVSVPKLH